MKLTRRLTHSLVLFVMLEFLALAFLGCDSNKPTPKEFVLTEESLCNLSKLKIELEPVIVDPQSNSNGNNNNPVKSEDKAYNIIELILSYLLTFIFFALGGYYSKAIIELILNYCLKTKLMKSSTKENNAENTL